MLYEVITCTTKDINGMLTSGEYRKKVDNFLIIQDASSSMSDRLGQYFVPYEPVKLDVSKKLLTCLNNNLPDDFVITSYSIHYTKLYDYPQPLQELEFF